MIRNIVFGTAVKVGKTMAESVHNYDEHSKPRRFIAQFSSRSSGALEMPVVQIVDQQGEFPTVETSTANVKYWIIQPAFIKKDETHDDIPWQYSEEPAAPAESWKEQTFVEDAPKKKGRPGKKVAND
jgi:hypothetical protein